MKERNIITLALLLIFAVMPANAQDEYNQINPDGSINQYSTQKNRVDSLGTDKEIPKGIRVWTIDERFGDIKAAQVDTLSHMFMNSIFTTGLRGEYNTTGNLGAPRQNRIFIDRQQNEQFLFTQPYDYFVTSPNVFHFTNTLSPFTNLTYNNAGNRTNGEDHLTAKFGVNAGKKIGVGFNFDYIYGRGYYNSQSTSHFKYVMYGSYIGDHYQAHLLLSTINQKVTENGGIINDNYITHPETFDDNYSMNEIPTVLEKNWNRNDNQHIYLSHRYSIGFSRKVKMSEEEIKARKFAIESQKENAAKRDKEEASLKARLEGREFDEKSYENRAYNGRPDNAKIIGSEPNDTILQREASDRIKVNGKRMADSLSVAEQPIKEDTMWMKKEYVPVTSFIHTMKFDNYRRIYQAYVTPPDYYLNSYPTSQSDSIFDKTKHYRLQNTFAISLLEGFNKWAKMGLKAFITSDLRHFELPDTISRTTSYNEHNINIGGQITKSLGSALHYNVIAETCLAGKDIGQLKIDASIDLNFPFLGDTVTLTADGFIHRLNPTFYMRHYHSRHFWWDDENMSKIFHSRAEGILSYRKTKSTLRVAFDEIKNYTYMAMSYGINDDDFSRTGNTVFVRQHSGAISLLTMALSQELKLGPINWENVVTFQKSSNEEVLPLPTVNIYTNLYFKFKLAHVLKCDFGADARFFTKYYAPDYSPALGQFAVQEGQNRTQVGNYPLINVYANFHLQRTRFFVMMSHVNAGNGNRMYFFTPHYPLNQRIFRFGVSWNFFN